MPSSRATIRGTWLCPSCNHAVSTAFCATCGEAPLRPRDLTFRGLIEQIAQSLTSIDGPLLRSAQCLISKPGVLTLSFVRGQRKHYTQPLSLFLFANVLFFAMQSLTGAKIFSTPLREHLGSDIWGTAATRLVTHRLDGRATNIERYAPVFDQAVAVNAKSLIIAMVVPFALLPFGLFRRVRRPFVTHVVFSLHFYSFLLVLLCASLAVVGPNELFGGDGLESLTFDHMLSVIEIVVCAVYLHIASAVVYGTNGPLRFFYSALLAMAVVLNFLGYRFALLPFTLYTT